MSGARCVLGRSLAAALAVALPVGVALAERKEPPPPLPLQHTHASGAFSFRTPQDWRISGSADRPEVLEAWGGDLGIRFLYREGESGFDSLHVDCCARERLAGPMDMAPQVQYEYDHVSGPIGERRALDSAFLVNYDNPVRGHRLWRQRTLTVVGSGQSLCVMSYAPAIEWKKSAKARATLDAVMASVTFLR